jgi:hypothetical protein
MGLDWDKTILEYPKKKEVKKGVPYEDWEQENFVLWLLNEYGDDDFLWYAVPNGELRDIRTANKLKRLGVKKGVPDMCFCVASDKYHGLYVEMKRINGGSVSKEQKNRIDQLSKYNYKAVVCRGYEAAKKEIKEYLNGMRNIEE